MVSAYLLKNFPENQVCMTVPRHVYNLYPGTLIEHIFVDVQVVAGDEAHDRAGGQQQHEAQVAGEQAVEQEKHVEQQPETKQENEVHPQQDAQPVQIQEVQAAEAQPV
jgi:hypothetical protein